MQVQTQVNRCITNCTLENNEVWQTWELEGGPFSYYHSIAFLQQLFLIHHRKLYVQLKITVTSGVESFSTCSKLMIKFGTDLVLYHNGCFWPTCTLTWWIWWFWWFLCKSPEMGLMCWRFDDFADFNGRPSCKKGVYRILADFHFLQDRANFWQTELFWHEKHRSVIVSVDLRFVLEKYSVTHAKRLSFAWSGILMSESFEGRFWRDANLNDYF